MTEIKITVNNLAKVLSVWGAMPEKLARGIALAMQKTALYATGKVKTTITSGTGMWKPPVDTGAMRRGIQQSSMSLFEPRVYIRPSSSTPYAKYVHEGTSRMKARPFFTITKQIHERDIKAFFQTELNKIIKTLTTK